MRVHISCMSASEALRFLCGDQSVVSDAPVCAGRRC